MTFQIEAPLLMWELFWKWVIFWFKGCSRHFCPKKRYGSKVFHLCQQEKRVMSQKGCQGVDNCLFSQHAPRVILKYHGPEACIFDYRKKIWQAWSCSKSWRIPNYQKSNPTKIHFCVAWFLKNSRKSFWIKNFIIHCLNRRDQRVHLIFSKSCLSGTKVFFQMVP